MTEKKPEFYDAQSLDDLIELKVENRAAMGAANNTVKALTKEREMIDVAIRKHMEKAGITRAGNDTASISISEEIVPNVHDWDAVYSYCKTMDDFSLIQRRLSAAAYRELLKMYSEIPGINPTTLVRVNMRSTKT